MKIAQKSEFSPKSDHSTAGVKTTGKISIKNFGFSGIFRIFGLDFEFLCDFFLFL